MVIIIFFVLHWYLSLFCQSFFLHRYAAHKMFSMSSFWEKFFYYFTYAMQGSSYLSPRAYAIMHRMHHAYSDTEKDPHSPHHASNVFTMMWKTKNIYNDFAWNKVAPEPEFDRDYPSNKEFEAFAEGYISRLAWVALYIGVFVIFATHWWMFLLLPITLLMGPVQGAIVNWSGHMYGYSNFDNNDKSKNSLIFDVIMMGELFQNNHHKLPNRANFAVKWWELDPTFPVMKILHHLRIIRLKKIKA